MSLRSISAALLYFLFAVALRATYGTYHPLWLWAMTGGVVGFAWCVLRKPAPTVQPADPSADPPASLSSPARVLWTIALALVVLLAGDPRIITADATSPWFTALRAANLVALVGVTLAWWMAWRTAWCGEGEGDKMSRWAWLGVMVAGLALVAGRVATLHAAPGPGIDVFLTNTQAADYFAAGVNPYGAAYADVYAGKYDYPSKFFYWPGYLWPAVVARTWLGDVRFAVVAADVATALALAWIGRRLALRPLTIAALPLLWLAHPVSLLVLELAWVDPVLIAWMALSIVALLLRRWFLLGVAVGAAMSVKQYGLLFALPLAIALGTRERRAFPTALLGVVVTLVALFGPFLVNDFRGFYDSTIDVYLHAGMRADALSLAVWLTNRFAVEPPGWLLLGTWGVLLAGMSVWLARRRHDDPTDLLAVAALAYAALFLLGKLAFCNYYYLVAFLVLLVLAFSLAADERRSPVAQLHMKGP